MTCLSSVDNELCLLRSDLIGCFWRNVYESRASKMLPIYTGERNISLILQGENIRSI